MEKKELFEQAIKKVTHFDNDILVQGVANQLALGHQVIVEVELYLGNGRWKLNEYRYKMLVPVFANDGSIYSTDVFKTIKQANNGDYGICHATRQNVTKLISFEIDADLSNERFGYGYRDEKYGHLTPEQLLENPKED